MGFGAMLAGGCAVGAGLSGGAVFALTAWLALFAMWVGAGVTDWLVDQADEMTPAAAAAEPEEAKLAAAVAASVAMSGEASRPRAVPAEAGFAPAE